MTQVFIVGHQILVYNIFIIIYPQLFDSEVFIEVLREGIDNLGFNLMQLMNEGIVTTASFCGILY